jgi:hypothetical protein
MGCEDLMELKAAQDTLVEELKVGMCPRCHTEDQDAIWP